MSAAPRRRVVLLGASNLTRGFRTVVGLARERLGAPLEVLAALGHGRSFGLESSFLFRSLPSIARCGLWDALEPGRPTSALVCDIGNDVAYGVSAERLSEWIASVLDRLERLGARPILAGLPLERIERLDPVWFAIWSRVLFPGRGLERERVLDEARAVELRLEREAARRGLILVAPRAAWFGSDPIHYARRRAPEAWGEILAAWSHGAEAVARGASVVDVRDTIRPPPAAERTVLGSRRRRKQPSATLADGTTLAIY